MTREALLEEALRAMLKAGREAVVAQERMDYHHQFGTNTATAVRADKRQERAIKALERAETMAQEALRGNVTLFNEAAAIQITNS